MSDKDPRVDITGEALLQELESFMAAAAFPGALKERATSARDRVVRDLLPRARKPAHCAVVGIVGPNNSGKSALFNALLGTSRPLSPDSPTGGFTRVLVGAVHPDDLQTAVAGLEGRFDLTTLGDRGPSSEEVQAEGQPERLLLTTDAGLPRGLILIDTPDFDSVYSGNRRAGEALVRTADLLVVVATPHTYQNRAVIEFLGSAVGHGRQYLVVYNQAQSPELARAHASKLCADIGLPPLDGFFCLHDARVQSHEAWLEPTRLDGLGESVAGVGDTLRDWLLSSQGAPAFISRAQAASWAALAEDLRVLGDQWRRATLGPRDARMRLLGRLRPRAESTARALFPVEPFREALQEQLDERSSFHRGVRYLPNELGAWIRTGYRAVAGLFREETSAVNGRDKFRATELERLLGAGSASGRGSSRALDELWEAVHEELEHEPRAVSEAALGDDFARERAGRLGPELRSLHKGLSVPFDDFRRECGESISQELEDRGVEAGLQWAYTALRLLPPAAAISVMALTGVAGDVGAGVAYLVAEPLLDRALGPEFILGVHERWWKQRRETLTTLLAQTLAPHSVAELEKVLNEGEVAASRLQGFVSEVAEFQERLGPGHSQIVRANDGGS